MQILNFQIKYFNRKILHHYKIIVLYLRYNIKRGMLLPKRSWTTFLKNGHMVDRTWWYLQAWNKALVPVCRQRRSSSFSECTDFRTSFTNKGLCFTRNGGAFDEMFKPTTYSSSFKNIMIPGRQNDSIRYTKGSGIQYQYTFVVDTNRHGELKRGTYRTMTTDSSIQLGIHSSNDIADIKGSGIDIHHGYETTIRIDFQELYSDPSIQSLDPKKRQCKFDDENGDLTVFKWYSRINCLYECNMAIVEKECGCRPWDYPSSINISDKSTTSRICDYFGNTCFHALMSTDDIGEKQCAEKCIPDCNEVKHSFSIEKSPLDLKTICHFSRKDAEVGAYADQRMDKSIKDMEISLKNHVYGFPQSPPKWDKRYPITNLIQTLTDAMTNQNKTSSKFEQCRRRVMKDMAVVNVVVNNPTVLKLIQTNRVSLSDKVANFGMNFLIINSILIEYY